MKKCLTILLILVSFISFAQNGLQYRPTVAWRTVVDSVQYLNADTFLVKVEPVDFRDPGASDRMIGNYLMDNIGHIFTIIDSSSTTITVVDEFDYGIRPINGKDGYVYKSVGDGSAPYIAPVAYEYLDSKAKDNADRLFKDILYSSLSTGGEIDPFYSADSANIVTYSDTSGLIVTQSYLKSYIHAEVGRIENLSSNNVSVAFFREFNNRPIGEEPQVYRWDNFKGNIRRDKVLWGWADASQPTTTGFELNIDNSESLANVIVEYAFFESIKAWILETGFWDMQGIWKMDETWNF